MNEDILHLSNSIVYDGVIQHGSIQVANDFVKLPKDFNSMISWLEVVKKQSVTFLKMDKIVQSISGFERKQMAKKNYLEAAITALIVDHFIHCGV